MNSVQILVLAIISGLLHVSSKPMSKENPTIEATEVKEIIIDRRINSDDNSGLLQVSSQPMSKENPTIEATEVKEITIERRINSDDDPGLLYVSSKPISKENPTIETTEVKEITIERRINSDDVPGLLHVSSKQISKENPTIEATEVKEITIERRINSNDDDPEDDNTFVFPFLFPPNITVEITEFDNVTDVKIIPKIDNNDNIDEVVLCSLLGRCADDDAKE